MKSIMDFNKVEATTRLLLKQTQEAMARTTQAIEDLHFAREGKFLLEYEFSQQYNNLIKDQQYLDERTHTLIDALDDDNSTA